jgi:outer membrane protein OmpA-like peptidoglycan-associated protein
MRPLRHAPPAPSRPPPTAAPPIAGARARPSRGAAGLGNQARLRLQGQPLPSAERAYFEAALGADLGHVRVHTDPDSGRLAQQLGARAFTVANHLVFAPDRWAPARPDGRALLAHELVHAVQQGGAPPPTGPIARASAAHEREAHGAAAVALAGGRPAISRTGAAQLACFSVQGHHVIEEVALAAAGFSEDERRLIERGNVERDFSQMPHPFINALLLARYNAFGGDHPRYHFDNQIYRGPGQFAYRTPPARPGPDTFTYLTEELRAAVRAGPTREAMIRLGNGFHAVEDFFSHTNFVRLLHGDHQFGAELISGSFNSRDQLFSAYNTLEELSSHPASDAYLAQAEAQRERTAPRSHSRIAGDHPTDRDYHEARGLAAMVIGDVGGEVRQIIRMSEVSADERERLFTERVVRKLRRYLAPPTPEDRWWEQMRAADPAIDERLDEVERRTPVTVSQVPFSPMRIAEGSRDAQFRFIPLPPNLAFSLGNRAFLSAGVGVNAPLDSPLGPGVGTPPGLFIGANLTVPHDLFGGGGRRRAGPRETPVTPIPQRPEPAQATQRGDDLAGFVPQLPPGVRVPPPVPQLPSYTFEFMHDTTIFREPDAFARLRRLTTLLREVPGLHAIIEGHASQEGTAEHNQALSERRAAAVVDALTMAGIEPSRLAGSGLGARTPVALELAGVGGLEAARARNRRVEILLFDPSGRAGPAIPMRRLRLPELPPALR